jgi:hypothetical protein
MDEGQVVHAAAEMRDEAANPFPALALPGPIPRAFHHRAGVALKQLHLAARIEFLAATFDEFGFVIEGVALAGATVHEELDDAFDFGAVVETAVEVGAGDGASIRGRDGGVSKQILAAQQMGKGDAAEAAAETPEEFAARTRGELWAFVAHQLYPVNPIPRQLVSLSNRENPNQVTLHDAGNLKRKHLQIHAPVILTNSGYFGILGDPIKTPDNLSIKAVTESGLFAIVVLDFGREFRICIRVKFDPHYGKRFSIFRLVS